LKLAYGCRLDPAKSDLGFSEALKRLWDGAYDHCVTLARV
jgi:hypothetical protein